MAERAAGQSTGPSLREWAVVADAAQMRQLGAGLATLLRPADLIVLTGPLGAGKTTLVQGIGEGLDVRGPVTSPTFVIARVHPSLCGGPDLVHADAYRLGSRLEVDDLDLDADLDHSVTVVEWGEGLVENLAPDHLAIAIGWAGPAQPGTEPGTEPGPVGGPGPDANGPGDEPRLVTVTGYGRRWHEAADQLRAVLSLSPRQD